MAQQEQLQLKLGFPCFLAFIILITTTPTIVSNTAPTKIVPRLACIHKIISSTPLLYAAKCFIKPGDFVYSEGTEKHIHHYRKGNCRN